MSAPLASSQEAANEQQQQQQQQQVSPPQDSSEEAVNLAAAAAAAAAASDMEPGFGGAAPVRQEPNNNNLKPSLVVLREPVQELAPLGPAPAPPEPAQAESAEETSSGSGNASSPVAGSPETRPAAAAAADGAAAETRRYTSSVVIECVGAAAEQTSLEGAQRSQQVSSSVRGRASQRELSKQVEEDDDGDEQHRDRDEAAAQHAPTGDNNNSVASQRPTPNPDNNNTSDINQWPGAKQKPRQDQQQQQQQFQTCKRKRLTALQRLLLRKWPLLALGLCTMGSLLFGVLLSGLTVYLLHGLTDCSGLVPAATRANQLLIGPLSELGPPELALSQRPQVVHEPGAAAAAAAAAALASPSTADQQAASKRVVFQRLPQNVWPQHYQLFVQPFIYGPHFNFTGRVAIQLVATAPTSRIQLHLHDLRVHNVTLTRTGGPTNGSSAQPSILKVSEEPQLQYLVVELAGPLEVGANYSLAMNFDGFLNEDLNGFYRIRYEQPATRETTWIAATQFQATDARRAFPCFDEPSHKATFSIQIKHWKNMTALSNMPIIDRQDSSDGLWVTDTFDRTPRMSTYLVAFAVTNFESRSQGNISVWARPGLSHTAEYALQVAGRILRFYEQFFGIEYPLPKVDMIALPDFNAGAMENWGLITFRETAMLYDNTSSSIVNKQRVAIVVAHELAHQWFGNLVTPKWWDDLWLNEGFASYVEYIGVNSVEPQWRMQDQFVVEEVQNVFRLDGLSSSHQISIPVNNPEEISEIFDQISYAKGASVIRMMNHFLTEPVFKAGLKTYLNELKYSNAEQRDLWRHLTAAYERARQQQQQQQTSGPGGSQQLQRAQPTEQIDVEKVMNSWTLQVGFPLVTVTRRYDGSGVASLNQARYRSYRLPNDTGADQQADQKWEVPITYTWKSEQNWTPNTRFWLRPDAKGPTETPRTDKVPDNEWLLVNIHEVGFYRVNYDQRNWRLLIDQLNADHRQISLTNRAQILDDLFELARSGQLDYRFAMESTKYLKSERDYMPWDTVLTSFSYIDDMLQRTAIYGDWKDYILGLIAPYYARYKDGNWFTADHSLVTGNSSSSSSLASPGTQSGEFALQGDSNDILEHFNLVNSIGWACQVDEHCIEKAKSLFAQWRKTQRNNIKPALRYTVYCTAIENGNKNDWEFLWRAYGLEQNASEKDRILKALACTKEHWLLRRYLDEAFSKDSKQIRRQDGSSVFRTVARNNYGRDLAFSFMRERWSTIRDFYAKSSFSFGNLIRSLSNSMNTRLELNELKAFYESVKNEVGTGKRAFQIAIEDVETNVLWHERNYQIIEQWLRETRA